MPAIGRTSHIEMWMPGRPSGIPTAPKLIETWSNCCEANQPAVYAPTA